MCVKNAFWAVWVFCLQYLQWPLQCTPKGTFFPHQADLHHPLLNQFQKIFLLSSLLRALQGLKNGRDLELRLAEPRSSFSLPLPIRLIPSLEVWDLKFYNRKTEDSSQSFYRRLFLHCGHCENCFLGGMGLLAAVLPVAAGTNCCAAKRRFFFP